MLSGRLRSWEEDSEGLEDSGSFITEGGGSGNEEEFRPRGGEDSTFQMWELEIRVGVR